MKQKWVNLKELRLENEEVCIVYRSLPPFEDLALIERMVNNMNFHIIAVYDKGEGEITSIIDGYDNHFIKTGNELYRYR